MDAELGEQMKQRDRVRPAGNGHTNAVAGRDELFVLDRTQQNAGEG